MSELPENETEIEIDDIGADIARAMKEHSGEDVPEKEEAAPEQDEPNEEPVDEAPKEPEIEAPTAWDATAKEKFKTLPRDVQELIRHREDEIHKGFTKQDEERTLGKRMKEVVTPYMAIIQSEGGTPETAVRDLLNTAYLLRTAGPEQKAAMVKQICQSYGVPIELVVGQNQQQYTDPSIARIQQELAQLRERANPEVIKKDLQEQWENDRLVAEVQAFASDPAHEHYELVKPIMASLLASDTAKDLKEAYDLACRAHPQVGSAIEAKKLAEIETKKKAELASKKKAAVSVSGSSSNSVANTKAPQKNTADDIGDDLRAAMSQLGYEL